MTDGRRRRGAGDGSPGGRTAPIGSLASKGISRQGRRTVSLLRHALRRSERHPSARTPPRAARAARLGGVAQPRRLALDQHARLPAGRRRTAAAASLPDRLRLDAGQRQHAGAGHSRGQRVHLGSAADADHDADARLLRAAVDQGELSRSAGDRPLRGELLPAGALEAGVPEPGVRQRAARRPLLGRAARRRDDRRGDPRGRPHGGVHGSGSDRVPDAGADHAPRQDRPALAERGAADRGLHAVAERDVHVLEHRGRREGRDARATGYTIEWATFDNATDTASTIGEAQTTTELSASAPRRRARRRVRAGDGHRETSAITRDGACRAASSSASSRPAGNWWASSGCRRIDADRRSVTDHTSESRIFD